MKITLSVSAGLSARGASASLREFLLRARRERRLSPSALPRVRVLGECFEIITLIPNMQGKNNNDNHTCRCLT